MKTASGMISLAMGLIFFALTGLAVTEIAATIQRCAEEPEDLLILSVLLVLLPLVGLVALLAGAILLRDRPLRWISTSCVTRAVLCCALSLFVVSVIAFVVSEPSSSEIRLLVVPALVLAWAYVLIRTHVANESKEAKK